MVEGEEWTMFVEQLDCWMCRMVLEFGVLAGPIPLCIGLVGKPVTPHIRSLVHIPQWNSLATQVQGARHYFPKET